MWWLLFSDLLQFILSIYGSIVKHILMNMILCMHNKRDLIILYLYYSVIGTWQRSK